MSGAIGGNSSSTSGETNYDSVSSTPGSIVPPFVSNTFDNPLGDSGCCEILQPLLDINTALENWINS